MKKIGITAGLIINKNSRFTDYKMVSVADNYVKSLTKVGAIPIVLPVLEDENIIKELIKNLDGIILTGGEDIHPKYYGEDEKPKLGEYNVERDEFDLKLAKIALELNIPILGICRGAQIINVASGGNLYQDIEYADIDSFKHDYEDEQALERHNVIIEDGSIISEVFGLEVMVNSFHHQSVKKLGKNLKITGISDDGIIESFEGTKKGNLVLGIQWHPEMMAANGNEKMINLFEKFVNHNNPLRSKDNISSYKQVI